MAIVTTMNLSSKIIMYVGVCFKKSNKCYVKAFIVRNKMNSANWDSWPGPEKNIFTSH